MATIPNSRVFLREYEVSSDMKLFKFHEFLQNDLGFSPDQMVLFQGINDMTSKKREYGLFDFGDGSMDTITLEKTMERGELSLKYIYNLDKNLYLTLTFIGEDLPEPRGYYPRTTLEKGQNPEQFSSRYEDFGVTGEEFQLEGDVADVDEESEE